MSRTSNSVLDQPSPVDFTSVIEAQDFLATHLPKLPANQQRVLKAWAAGATVKQLAQEEGVTTRAIVKRLNKGVARLQEFAREYF